MKNFNGQNSVYISMQNTTYIYDCKETNPLKTYFKEDYCYKYPLSVVEAENGIILPYKCSSKPVWGLGGVLRQNSTFIEESSWGASGNKIFGGKYDYDVTQTINMDDTVVYMGHIIGHWGSFLSDHISRLWYILQDPQQYRIAYCGIGFEPNTFGQFSKHCYEFLNLLGIPKEQLIDIRIPTKFKKVIVPQLSFYPGEFYSREYKTIFETASRNVQCEVIKNYEKIYFTRRQLSKHKEIGEKEIEKFFSQNGFKILAPEKLTINEQIYYIKKCKIMASIEGTIAHYVLFASNDMVQQIILRKQSEINARQHIFNQIANIPTIYIDVYVEPYKGFPISHDDGPFLLRFNRNIKCYANDNSMSFKNTFETAKYLWDFIYYTYKCFFEKCMVPIYVRLKQFPIFHRIYKSLR